MNTFKPGDRVVWTPREVYLNRVHGGGPFEIKAVDAEFIWIDTDSGRDQAFWPLRFEPAPPEPEQPVKITLDGEYKTDTDRPVEILKVDAAGYFPVISLVKNLGGTDEVKRYTEDGFNPHGHLVTVSKERKPENIWGL